MSNKKYRLVKDGLARVKSIFTFNSADDFRTVEENSDDNIWTEDVGHEVEFIQWESEPIDTLSFKWNGVLGLTTEEYISLEGALMSHFEDNQEFMKDNPDVAKRIESAWDKIAEMDTREKDRGEE